MMAATVPAVEVIASEVLQRLPVELDATGRASVAMASLSLVLRVLAGELANPPQVDPELLALRQAVDRLYVPRRAARLNPREDRTMLAAMRVLSNTLSALRSGYAAEELDAEARATIGQGLRLVLAMVEGRRV